MRLKKKTEYTQLIYFNKSYLLVRVKYHSSFRFELFEFQLILLVERNSKF